MYGTIAKLKVAAGKVEALKSHMASLKLRPVPGFVSASLYQMDADPDEFYLAVLFDGKASYVANAQRPETNADYEKLMQLLVAAPEWHDGQVVVS